MKISGKRIEFWSVTTATKIGHVQTEYSRNIHDFRRRKELEHFKSILMPDTFPHFATYKMFNVFDLGF